MIGESGIKLALSFTLATLLLLPSLSAGLMQVQSANTSSIVFCDLASVVANEELSESK